MRCHLFPLALLFLATAAGAQTFGLPLNGYYHPGRWMPVQWDLPGASNLEIFGSGAARTVVSGARPHGVAPCLALGALPDGLYWRASGSSGRIEPANLHPLERDEMLVGLCLDDPTLANDIFPGHPIVVPLDAADPLPNAGMAWQTLDAAVLSPESLRRISPDSRAELCAAGVTLAVSGQTPPDDGLKWQRRGRLWVAPAPPAPPLFDPHLYAVLSLPSERSAAYRGRVLLLAALVCILAAGLALWRWRWMPAAQVAVAAVALGGLWWWNQGQSPVSVSYGDVFVTGDSVPVRDRWLFPNSPREADFHVAIDGAVNFLFCDARQPAWSALELSCGGGGQARMISGKLRPYWPLGLVGRSRAEGVPEASGAVSSPLRNVASDGSIYPGTGKMAQDGAAEGAWPAIVLTRQ